LGIRGTHDYGSGEDHTETCEGGWNDSSGGQTEFCFDIPSTYVATTNPSDDGSDGNLYCVN